MVYSSVRLILGCAPCKIALRAVKLALKAPVNLDLENE